MLLGIDKGTTFTKTNEGFCIRSTIKKYEDDILEEKTFVEIDGEKYSVGEDGEFATDLQKSKHINTKILTLTTLALSSNNDVIEAYVVLGLPIGQYTKQKENMKTIFNTWDIQRIKLNNKPKLIKIMGIEVFPEGAGAFYSQDKYRDCLIVDIGGLSIDTASFEDGKLKKYSTYNMGIMKLYSKIANKINSDYDLSLTEWNIPKILNQGLYIYGERQKLGIKDLLYTHTKEILSRLKLEYDIKAMKVLLTGGGSIILEEFIKETIPQVEMLPDPQFNNAKGFYNIGKVVFR